MHGVALDVQDNGAVVGMTLDRYSLVPLNEFDQTVVKGFGRNNEFIKINHHEPFRVGHLNHGVFQHTLSGNTVLLLLSLGWWTTLDIVGMVRSTNISVIAVVVVVVVVSFRNG